MNAAPTSRALARERTMARIVELGNAQLAESGVGILLISDEVPEVFYNCDRVLHMRDGRIVGEVVQSKAPEVKEDPSRPGHYPPVDPFGPDWATFRLTDPQVKLLASAPGMAPRTVGTARVGDPVCQLGSVNGRRCGTVTKVVNDWVVADIVTTQGDSGGPLIRTTDNAAIGIITDAVTLTDRDSGKVTQQLTQYYSLNAALRAAGGARLATN